MFKSLKIKGLCKPAKFYLYLSIAGIVMSIIQNMRKFDNSNYKCGSFSVNVPSVMLIFAFKIVYILFWTYVLNLLCKDNNVRLAWLLVLFPIILLFVILGMLLLTGGVEKNAGKEGFREGMHEGAPHGDEAPEEDEDEDAAPKPPIPPA
jgi:hypothetical protein